MCMGDLSLAGENAHGAQMIHLIKSYASQVAWRGRLSLIDILAAKHATSLP
jgi:hypothetical protein